jgi:hypothetical protein
MVNEILRGSRVALIIWALSIVCLYERLIPTYYFAGALGVWLTYSLYKLFGGLSDRSGTLETRRSDKDATAYWLGAVTSSLLAPLLWMLIVSQIRVF